jgi:methionine--tRNA ligase beta chain
MDKISIDDFSKIEMRIGEVKTAEKIEDTDKLLRLEVDFGDEVRQIVSGIAHYYPDPEVLVGKQLPFITNLEPRTIRGFESNGMLLAVGGGEEFVALVPEKKVSPGTSLK